MEGVAAGAGGGGAGGGGARFRSVSVEKLKRDKQFNAKFDTIHFYPEGRGSILHQTVTLKCVKVKKCTALTNLADETEYELNVWLIKWLTPRVRVLRKLTHTEFSRKFPTFYGILMIATAALLR